MIQEKPAEINMSTRMKLTNLDTFLLRYLGALLPWNLAALLSGLVPARLMRNVLALFPRLIPAILFWNLNEKYQH
jgi:hypothetical protein